MVTRLAMCFLILLAAVSRVAKPDPRNRRALRSRQSFAFSLFRWLARRGRIYGDGSFIGQHPVPRRGPERTERCRRTHSGSGARQFAHAPGHAVRAVLPYREDDDLQLPRSWDWLAYCDFTTAVHHIAYCGRKKQRLAGARRSDAARAPARHDARRHAAALAPAQCGTATSRGLRSFPRAPPEA